MINLILAVALSLRSSMFRCEAVAADGLNAADCAAPCVLERQSSGKLSDRHPKIMVPSEPVDEIREIVAATTNAKNITSVPEDATTDETTAKDTACRDDKNKEVDCKKHWDKWRAVKKAEAQRNPPRFKPLTDSQRINPAAAGFIDALRDMEDQATSLYGQLKASADNAANPEKSPAITKLSNAKYGQGKTKVEGGPGAGHGGGSDRGNGCKTPNTGTSLVHDFFCLCVTDTTSRASKPCGFEVNNCNSGNWEACTETNKQTAWTTVENKCKEIYQGATTAQHIRAGLSAFVGRLQRDAGADIASQAAVFLGKSQTQACGAHATNLCVDYSHAFKDTTRKNGIYWYKQLEAAADDMNTLAKEQADLNNKIRGLDSLNSQARQLYKLIAAAPTATAVASSTSTNSQNANTEEKQKACENIKKLTECKDKEECKWDSAEKSDGDLCKAKDGENKKTKDQRELQKQQQRNAKGNWNQNAQRLLNANGVEKMKKIHNYYKQEIYSAVAFDSLVVF
uniref:Variant surface glycoprotein 710 n=1 Tax=Trypanosoma brucei TaxID=5691 RepID=M4SV64_9TRYP|nr:variant surface glycoprotein 710 [Trypanosoma brucei]